MKAWHFLPADRRLRFTGESVRVGQTIEVCGPIVPEKWGLHAAKRLLDAVFWAPSLLLTRVELSGTVVEGTREIAASRRTVLWMGDVTVPFWMWAIERAQSAVCAEANAGRAVDPVFLRALQARKNHLAGRISLGELLQHRGPSRSLARRAAGRNTRSRKIEGAVPWPPGARTAATRCALLVDGADAHRHIAACPLGAENSQPRIVECDRLEKIMLNHFRGIRSNHEYSTP